MKSLLVCAGLVMVGLAAASPQAPVAEWRIRVESLTQDSVLAELKYVTSVPDGRAVTRRRYTPFEVHVDAPALTCLVQAAARDRRLKVTVTEVVDDRVRRSAGGEYATTACWARLDGFGVFGN
jgi:hypothetical protein